MASTVYSHPLATFNGHHWDKSLPNRSDVSPSLGFTSASPSDREIQDSDPDADFARPRRTSPSAAKETRRFAIDDHYDEPASKNDLPPPNNVTDDSLWVHRDKLAQIETREMQEAGLHVQRRGRHDKHSAEEPSMEGADEHDDTNDSAFDGHETSGRLPATDDFCDRQRYDGMIETNGFGYEDVNLAHTPNPGARSDSRPGTSRIPVSKNSPVPIPNVHRERGSPLDRSRQGSLALSASSDTGTSPRDHRRSRSVGADGVPDIYGSSRSRTGQTRPRPSSALIMATSQLDDSTDSPDSPSAAAKPRVVKTATPSAKKASQPRKASAAKPSAPASRESPVGRKPRPTSINRPVGEAPWIATMYKPDPMLPPDQQIVPTHAKRLLQEQWAREGRTGNVYDRNFNLVNAVELPAAPVTRYSPPPAPPALPTPAPPIPNYENVAPPEEIHTTHPPEAARSGDARAYRITPVTSRSGSVAAPGAAQRLAGVRPQTRMNPSDQRGPEKVVAPGKEGKGCGCCVVM